MLDCSRLLLAAVFLLSLNNGPALAQDASFGRIEGRIVAESDDDPLVGATVGIKGANRTRGTTTDRDGRFELTKVRPGSVTVQVRFVGYITETRTVDVSAGEVATLSVALKRSTVALAGVEITGSNEEARTALTGAMTTVDAAEIQRIDPIGMQEALSYVPGVYGLSDDGMGQTRMSVGLRGLQPRRTQRVLVMEDGIPIQPAPYVFSPLYYNPPIDRIRNVEVIKGASSVRHGPQTMAGVINYVTSRPRRITPGGRIKVTGGTNRYASVFSEFGGFGTPDVRPQVQMIFKRGDGFRENNDFIQFNGTAKLQATIGSARSIYVKANVDYERMNATYTGVTPYTLATDPDFNPKDDDQYRIFRASLGAIYERRFSDRVEASTTVYANVLDRPWWREKDVFVRADEYENPNIDAEPVAPSTPGPLIRVGISDAVEGDLTGPYYGNERRFYVGGVEQTFEIDHGVFGQPSNLEIGGRVHWERFRDDRKISDEVGKKEGVYFRGDPSNLDSIEIVGGSSTYETTALALYGQEEIQWGRLRMTPGFRLEVFEQSRINRLAGSTYDDKTSVVPLPSFGFNLDLGNYDLGSGFQNSRLWLFGGIHRGYTPPSSATFQIVGFEDPSALPGDDDGFDLRAEKSWNSELGLRGRSGAAQFEVAGFYLYVEDLVGGRTSFQQNLGVVESYGVETQASFDFGTYVGWMPRVDATYTYLDSEVVQGIIPRALGTGLVDISGNQLPAAPNHTATVRVSKTLEDLGLMVYGDMRYRGMYFTDLENLPVNQSGAPPSHGERGPVPSNAIFNAGIRYDATDAVRLQLTAKNVTDNVYIGSRIHSNPRQRDASLSTGIIPGARRQVNLSVTYDF
ncbi:TonB-dependent receptor [Longibacter salinarum]|uniref:TonB-dependent receptor n=1 Tax=Longibacter salinarum TaxID=1850348 RepID=A0A2A8D081_9BACT|nr:TonB-dependent receptor [Longibacter salinarum]PEN14280.1 TonB-dependent receptor [Longibacter salinarum]